MKLLTYFRQQKHVSLPINHVSVNPYMNVSLTLNYDGSGYYKYNWDVREICPTEEIAYYLKHMPYSSCALNNKLEDSTRIDTSNALYNVYVFSDRYSSTLQFLDDKG